MRRVTDSTACDLQRAGSRRDAAMLWLFRLLAMTASLIVTCGLLEIGLRLFHPIPLHPTDSFLSPRWNRDGPTARAGFMHLVPGAVSRYQSDEFDTRVRINSRGFRAREFALRKPPGVFR